MKAFFIRRDGGHDSNVTGYWLIEWKRVFSVALLRFSDGARDCYHSHAFNCVSWVLRGQLDEDRLVHGHSVWSVFGPSMWPIVTTRNNLHRVHSQGTTWVLTFRGPWVELWHEFKAGRFVTLTHGRKEVV